MIYRRKTMTTPFKRAVHRSGEGARIAVIASFSPSLINFRGHLLGALTARGHHVIAIAPNADDAVRTQLEGIGADYIDVPLKRMSISPLEDILFFFRLARIFRDRRPTHVLVYTIKPIVYGSLAAQLVSGARCYSIVTGVGFVLADSEAWKRRLLQAVAVQLYRYALRGNVRVFFQNPDNLRAFIERRILRDDVRTVLINGSGVDLDMFRLAPLSLEPSFLMIARLLNEKGVREYAEAARRVGNGNEKVSCCLVGWIDGGVDSIDQAALDQWVAEGVIQYLGKLDDVRPAISESSVYVLPSYHEGTPRSVLEAMAMGRPIITTDVPGCRETVIDGVNGFLVPPRDSEALAEAMQRFIDEPDLISKMGAESRRIAEEKYDVHKVNQVILDAMGL